MSNDKIKQVASTIVVYVKRRIDEIEKKGEITLNDAKFFTKMERRMITLAKANGQDDFDSYSRLAKHAGMIHNASVFSTWNKDAKDVIPLLVWVKSQL